jgi:hypothetical protein
VGGRGLAFKIFQKVVIQELEGKYRLARLVRGWVQSTPEQLNVLGSCVGTSTEDNRQVMDSRSMHNGHNPTTIVNPIWWHWLGRSAGNVFQVKPSLLVDVEVGIEVFRRLWAPITLVTEVDNRSHFPEPTPFIKNAGPSFDPVEWVSAVGCPAAFCTICRAGEAIETSPICLFLANETNLVRSFPVQ